MRVDVSKTLKKYWGHTTFRPLQAEIIESVLSQHDTVGILPTGSGKSVCFQVPALLLPGVTVVISPLIALMIDQVNTLMSKGISATYISSSLTVHEIRERLNLYMLGVYKIVYVSPERLGSKAFIKATQKTRVSLVVIDEAHCISQWGSTFRPDYAHIPTWVNALTQRPPILAVTATASSATLREVCNSLQLSRPQVFVANQYRPNLHLKIIPITNMTVHFIVLLRLLYKHYAQSGIIYVATRKTAVTLADMISNLLHTSTGVPYAIPYHGNLATKTRHYNQLQFQSGLSPVVVATTAFGMGIDMPHIRYVIHMHAPSSIEEYAQQIGRAGRDRNISHCYWLHNPATLHITRSLVHTHVEKNKLKELLQFAEQQRDCRVKALLKYFNQTQFSYCYCCDWCLPVPQPSHQLLTYLQNKAEYVYLKKILSMRKSLATKYNATLTTVCSDTAAIFLAILKPQTTAQASLIPGIGTGWLQQWGSHFINNHHFDANQPE